LANALGVPVTLTPDAGTVTNAALGFGSKFRALTIVAGAPFFGWAL
jgi:hypothetical protein